MYNSVIGYAFKIIKGNMFFSVIMFIIISQLMVVNSIFSLVWKYEILIQQEINFFRQFSIYSLYIFIFILLNLIFKNWNIKIFLLIALCFPITLFSIVGFNGEPVTYVFAYIIKYLIRPKLYLYKKY